VGETKEETTRGKEEALVRTENVKNKEEREESE
jgi:hypothetical protein